MRHPQKGQRGARFLTTGAGYSTVKIQHHQWATRLLHSMSWAQRTHHLSFSRAHLCVMKAVVTFNSLRQHTFSLEKGDNILLLLLLEIRTWKDRLEESNSVLLLSYSRGCTTTWAGRTALSRGEKGENSWRATPTPACSNVMTVTKLLASSFSCHGSKCSPPPPWRKGYKIT